MEMELLDLGRSDVMFNIFPISTVLQTPSFTPG